MIGSRCAQCSGSKSGPEDVGAARKGFGSLVMGPIVELALGDDSTSITGSGLIWKLSALVSDGLETKFWQV